MMLDAGAKATPLCPAGHLPLKGGDWPSRRLSPIVESEVDDRINSPLEGEMPGPFDKLRAEGGVTATAPATSS